MNSSTKRRWLLPVIILILLLIIIGLIIGVMNLMLNRKDETPSTPPGGVVFDPNAGDYVSPDDTTPQIPNIAIPGWASITIPPYTKDGITTDFFNPIENEGKYHMTFELRLIDPSKPEGYEVLYTSGLVEAGKHIQKIDLTRALEPGTYAGYVHVQPYFASNLQPTNNTNTSIEIIVK